MLAFLRLASVLQERGPEHPQTQALQRGAAPEAAHLLAEDARLLGGQAGAAVLAWPGGRRIAALRHAIEPGARVGIDRRGLRSAPDAIVSLGRRRAHGRRTVLLEPAASYGAERLGVAAAVAHCRAS